MAALINSDLPDLTLISRGKVRDIYSTSSPDHLLFVASDRISAYDVILQNVSPATITIVICHLSKTDLLRILFRTYLRRNFFLSLTNGRSDYKFGGLNLNAGHFAQLSMLIICYVYTTCSRLPFYSCSHVPSPNRISILSLSVCTRSFPEIRHHWCWLNPRRNIGYVHLSRDYFLKGWLLFLSPPRGRFSHLAMFRIGTIMFIPAYLTVVLYRPLANKTLLMNQIHSSCLVRCPIKLARTALIKHAFLYIALSVST